ncbi:hypothetical protein CRE_17445 [Caenorhabditis remanei]|uniref:DUF38 domain-containing protein n=1 Tax=Caenorhabditis remanei TaxID=31234 RepID=E3N229_CAERE|nr:hypothetical protein CRE_17445 [Caenorhabditis remanei]
MPIPLSYPGFKCVLEHLEAVKRAHIIARAPGFRKVDKFIPLRLKELYFKLNEVTINTLTIKCDKNEVRFKMNGNTFSRERSASREDKMMKLINFYFGGKSIIHVDEVDWAEGSVPDFLPVDLKFRMNSLAANSNQFDTLLPFIDPRSFPLKTVVTFCEPSTYNSHIATSAETLILGSYFNTTITLEELKKLKNERVLFERFSYSRMDMVALIKYQKETKKATGTTFVIATDDKSFIDMMLRELEQAFGKYRSDLDGVNERFIPGWTKFLIPINNESRIQVYAIELPGEGGRREIAIKPVSAVI